MLHSCHQGLRVQEVREELERQVANLSQVLTRLLVVVHVFLQFEARDAGRERCLLDTSAGLFHANACAFQLRPAKDWR
jgi:hypothetical protein